VARERTPSLHAGRAIVVPRPARPWIPPGGLLAGFVAHGMSWGLLLALSVQGRPLGGFAALAWLHLVALGWLTTLALSILIHVVPSFTNTPWKCEGVARGSIVVYAAGVAALVGAFWVGAVWALPWAGAVVVIALLAYLVPAAWTLSGALDGPRVEAAIARALLLTLASLIVTAGIGVVLATALQGRLPAGVLQSGPMVHATFGIVGWLTVLVTGVSARTLGPIAGARSRFAWPHIAVGTAQLSGLIIIVVGFLFTVAPIVWAGAALISLSALLYAGNLADVLRRATVKHRPPQAFIGIAAIWLIVGLTLAMASLASAPTASAAMYVLLVGWIGQMVNAHMYHIGIRLVATMTRGEDDETRPAELLLEPLSWGSFFFFQAAVAAGTVALLFDSAHLLAAAALCGLAGWFTMSCNVANARQRAIRGGVIPLQVR
jgi:hypothetical protein